MRILIDMQGAQTSFSKHRGVGRYTLEMVKALIATCPRGNQILLALNGAFEESVKELRNMFDHSVGYDNIKVWQQFFDTTAIDTRNAARVQAGEILREEFLNSFSADVILSTNLQEGFLDPAVTSVKLLPSKAFFCTTLHDVTPLLYPEKYLVSDINTKWYKSKIDFVKDSDMVLTVSEYSKEKIHELLGIPLNNICVTYNAIDTTVFKPLGLEKKNIMALLCN